MFKCVVTHVPPCPETGAPGTAVEELAAKDGFETLAAAVEFGTNEAHGVSGAIWTITALLTPTKACNAIKASRNNRLYAFVHMDAHDPDSKERDLPSVGSVELRAPQVVAIVEALFKGSDRLVRFEHYPGHMFVG